MPGDKPFLESLYKSTREDLELIVGESTDFIEHLKEQQQSAQIDGYGDQFPNALYFIIEYHREKVGRIVVDFGHNEIRVVDLTLVKAARGKGLGSAVLRSFVECAEQVKAPLTLSVLTTNIAAKKLYFGLGFVIEYSQPPRDHLIYYPKSQGIRIGP